MKKYIVICGLFLSVFYLIPTAKAVGDKVIADLDGRGLFGDRVVITRVQDGSVSCYIATAKQQSSNMWLSGTMISISCTKVK